MNKRFSWHSTQWQTVLGPGLGRLAHANLLIGAAGLGKRGFAEQLAAVLLCEAPTTRAAEAAGDAELAACGACPSCRWLDSAAHPDMRVIAPTGDEAEPEEGGKKKRTQPMIRIDDIRGLEEFVFVGSHRQGRRVVRVEEAERMNIPAANALLKLLEEPPAGVYFILTCSNPRLLLPTIRSRCRTLPFLPPTRAEAEAWLRTQGAESRAAKFIDVAGGAPLRVMEWQERGLLGVIETLLDALAKAKDPLVLARQWDELLRKEAALDADLLVETVQRWLLDVGMATAGLAPRFHTRWNLPDAHHLPSALTAARGWRELLRFRRSARHPLNQQLFLEEFAVFAMHALSPDAPRRAA